MNEASIALFKNLGFRECNYVSAFKEYEYEFIVVPPADSSSDIVPPEGVAVASILLENVSLAEAERKDEVSDSDGVSNVDIISKMCLENYGYSEIEYDPRICLYNNNYNSSPSR